MHRIDADGHVDNQFVDPNPQSGTPPTVVDAAILNAFQEEIAAVVEGAGITLDKAKSAQLLEALAKLLDQGIAGDGYYSSATDAVTFPPFWVVIDGVVYRATANVVKTWTGLGSENWYFIYLDKPSSGLILSASEFSMSTEIPTLDLSKKGRFNAAGDKCIGAFVTNASSEVIPCVIKNGLWRFVDPESVISTGSPPGTLTALYPRIPDFGETEVELHGEATSITLANGDGTAGTTMDGKGPLGTKLTNTDLELLYLASGTTTIKQDCFKLARYLLH